MLYSCAHMAAVGVKGLRQKLAYISGVLDELFPFVVDLRPV